MTPGISAGESGRRAAPARADIERIGAERFRVDRGLRAELKQVMAPSYEDPSALLDRDLAHCTHLYLARDADRRAVCFFMVAWEHLAMGDGSTAPAIFMGLSATRQDTKSSGLVRRAYAAAMADALEYERQIGRRLIAWATTATPSSYLFSTALLADVEPLPDASFSPRGRAVATAIRHQFRYDLPVTGHPFALRAVAHSTRYSPLELHRVARVIRGKEFSLFETLKIRECEGDRLLIVGRTPHARQ